MYVFSEIAEGKSNEIIFLRAIVSSGYISKEIGA